MKILADKTIKELADELGVSKDKIKYQVRKLPSNNTYKKGNITYLKKEAISRIYTVLGNEGAGKNTQLLPSDYLLSELKKKDEYLMAKDSQIAEKDQQLATMQKLLDQQQQLTLQSNKRIEQLEQQLQLGSNFPEEEQPSAEEQKKAADSAPDKKWWHFLRRDS